MRYAQIGSISHGTMRTEDLLEAFTAELQYHADRNKADLSSDAAERFATLLGEAYDVIDEPDADDADDIVQALADALGEFAPPYCYFGANEGDGSDYGFWPSRDAIEELPRVNDPGEVPEGGTGEDCVFVNDHGNVTVYGADGKVVLELV